MRTRTKGTLITAKVCSRLAVIGLGLIYYSNSGLEYVDDDGLEIPDADPGEIVIEEDEDEIVIEESQLTESTFNSTVGHRTICNKSVYCLLFYSLQCEI